jgi:hypothetical protein
MGVMEHTKTNYNGGTQVMLIVSVQMRNDKRQLTICSKESEPCLGCLAVDGNAGTRFTLPCR